MKQASSLPHGDAGGPFVSHQERDMDKQESEISSLELTNEELADVSGGMNNNQTAAWHSFIAGIVLGYVEAGGILSVHFGEHVIH
jgi:hypothetical protein